MLRATREWEEGVVARRIALGPPIGDGMPSGNSNGAGNIEERPAASAVAASAVKSKETCTILTDFASRYGFRLRHRRAAPP